MSQKSLERMLFDQFEQTYSRVTKNWRGQMATMAKEMAELCLTFGRGPVMAKFASDFGIPFPEILEKMNSKANKPVRRASSQSEPKKTRCRRRRCLSYSELRPHVIEAINSLYTGPGSADICTKEIESKLEEKKLLFKRSHMSLIILRDLEGLVKTGNTVRDGRRQPMNIYRITGSVKLRSTKRFRKVG